MDVLSLALLIVALPWVVTMCMLRLLHARPEATLSEAGDALSKALGWFLPRRSDTVPLLVKPKSRILDDNATDEV
jgi:hypothetical protein